MAIQNNKLVLAAESNQVVADYLLRCLFPLGLRVCLARSVEEIFKMLRQESFSRAVVAVELFFEGKAVLNHLSRLSRMEHIVAIGPQGDAEAEVKARLAGANLYVTRPVSTEILAKALRISPTRRLSTRYDKVDVRERHLQ